MRSNGDESKVFVAAVSESLGVGCLKGYHSVENRIHFLASIGGVEEM